MQKEEEFAKMAELIHLLNQKTKDLDEEIANA